MWYVVKTQLPRQLHLEDEVIDDEDEEENVDDGDGYSQYYNDIILFEYVFR